MSMAGFFLYPSPEGGGWSAKPTGWGVLKKSDPTPLALLAATLPLQGRDGARR
jgi:hypothetical protein